MSREAPWGEAGSACVRQNRVVPAVVATVKSCGCGIGANRRGAGEFRKTREARRNSAPGRARHKPSDHCAGKAVCSAPPVCCCAVSLRYTFAQQTAGARSAPGLPCALCFKGVNGEQNSGEMRRENIKVRLQVEMRAGRLTLLPHTPSLRAQRSNPESFRGGILDCFVALAMTAWSESMCAKLRSRASDAAQRPFGGRCRAGAHLAACPVVTFWVPALRSSARALRRIREARAPEPATSRRLWRDRIGSTKNPLSTVARRTLMNQPRLVHKRRPAAGFRFASRA